MGWTDDRYEYYQRGLSSGGAVVTVTGDRISEARTILQRDGADLRESGFESDSSGRSMRALLACPEQKASAGFSFVEKCCVPTKNVFSVAKCGSAKMS